MLPDRSDSVNRRCGVSRAAVLGAILQVQPKSDALEYRTLASRELASDLHPCRFGVRLDLTFWPHFQRMVGVGAPMQTLLISLGLPWPRCVRGRCQPPAEAR